MSVSREPLASLQVFFDALMVDERLVGDDLRVLFFLLSRLNFKEPVAINQREIVAVAGMKKEHVSRSMRTLTESGVIIQGPQKAGRSSMWRLNADYGK